jgi:hypothetical protein
MGHGLFFTRDFNIDDSEIVLSGLLLLTMDEQHKAQK